jgi:hypothetical protein
VHIAKEVIGEINNVDNKETVYRLAAVQGGLSRSKSYRWSGTVETRFEE